MSSNAHLLEGSASYGVQREVFEEGRRAFHQPEALRKSTTIRFGCDIVHLKVYKLLELPVEIRTQIYQYLLMDSSIIISSLFVRVRFEQKFMSKHNCGLHPGILYTCRQINNEASLVLYGSPLFQCATATLGLERLRAQIGTKNFSNIRRIVCDPSDLADVSEALQVPQGMSLYQRYQRVESLCTDGYRIKVLDGVPPSTISERLDLAEALRLCKHALAILKVHPKLSVLAQTLHGISNGGADAVDTSNSRAKWRLLKCKADITSEETPVDLESVVEFLSNNMKGCGRSTNAGQSNFVDEAGAWSYKQWLESYNPRARDGPLIY